MKKCSDDVSQIEEEDVWKLSGTDFGVTFHTIAQIIGFVFTAIAVIISLVLIFEHATHYSRPWEQKQIIRILLMIPIYAAVSLLSIHYYTNHIYFEVIRDCYEAFAISSFFTLLCHYIAPTLHEQKEYFRNVEPKNWVWPMTWAQKCSGGQDKGWLRKPRSGLTWFNIIWISVFQYCFIRVLFTIISVIAEKEDMLCEDSLSPAYVHIWSLIIESIAVTIAMYCLIQFYIQLKQDLAQYSPFLKVLCIKLVIFFCFWQSTLIDFLTSNGVLKTSKYLAAADISVGLPNVLICFEMAFFAVLHLFAFPYKPYKVAKTKPEPSPFDDPSEIPGKKEKKKKRYYGGCLGTMAIVDAFNPWDIIKATARGTRWLFVGVRHRHMDRSYSVRLQGAASPSSVEMSDQPQTYARARDDHVATMDDEFDRRSSLNLDSEQSSPVHEHPDERRGRVQNNDYMAARDRSDSDTAYHGYTPPRPGNGDNQHLLTGSQAQRPTNFV
ncbi:organic solute transporter Ostalpha-domain-containing protein [Phyllosticta citribraziliensis]|uniref:Organic solute transporter Ostalpha-domain-containing protein n=1 Tax=Phyllosticta citribraziliensis TaxID=989973 RepID=A0ABR1M9S5_9PEZI